MPAHTIAKGPRVKLLLLSLLVAITLAAPAISPAPAVAGRYGPEQGCGSTASHRTIQEGNTGKSVKHLQCLLNKRGFDLDVDGIFGPKTHKAVRKFQRNQGLAVDGIVGENTWFELHEESFPGKPKAP